MKEVEVEALKPFNRTPQGDPVHPGDPPFMVGEVRAGELEAIGLARRTGHARNVARADAISANVRETRARIRAGARTALANKMAPAVENKVTSAATDDKVAPGPKPVAASRRSPRQDVTKLSGGQG